MLILIEQKLLFSWWPGVLLPGTCSENRKISIITWKKQCYVSKIHTILNTLPHRRILKLQPVCDTEIWYILWIATRDKEGPDCVLHKITVLAFLLTDRTKWQKPVTTANNWQRFKQGTSQILVLSFITSPTCSDLHPGYCGVTLMIFPLPYITLCNFSIHFMTSTRPANHITFGEPHDTIFSTIQLIVYILPF